MATGGDPALGGDDFDALLAHHWLEGWGLRSSDLNASEWRSLLRMARRLKESLSGVSSPSERVSSEWNRGDGTRPLAIITQAEFEVLTKPLVDRSIDACARAMSDAGLSPSQIQGVVLVGGSTRLVNVRAAAEAFFQQRPKADIHPTRSWPSGPRFRPIYWLETAQMATTGCCWMSFRSVWASRPWAISWRRSSHGTRHSSGPCAGVHDLQGRPDGHGPACGSG